MKILEKKPLAASLLPAFFAMVVSVGALPSQADTRLRTPGVVPAFFMPGGDNGAYCSKTARTLYNACHLDVLDDFKETNANCINVVDPDERAECFSEAKTVWMEDWKACRDQRDARYDVCEPIGEERYANPLVDPAIVFLDLEDAGEPSVPNPYVNLSVGHTYVLQAGEDFEETVIVRVTDEVREAQGYDEDHPVLCRVVVDAVMIAEKDDFDVFEEWVAEEITDDYFAQDDAGIVYYCGEIARNFEDGYLDNLDGSFFSGVDFAKAGVLMRQDPIIVGQVDRQEYAIAEAEDVVEYVDSAAIPSSEEGDQNSLFPCIDSYGDCIKTFDSSALEPESTEYKYYKSGTGFVLAVAMEDGEITGEREELVCVGSPDLAGLGTFLETDCGLEEVDELLEELCELAPDAFCED